MKSKRFTKRDIVTTPDRLKIAAFQLSHGLTNREVEVMQGLALGKPYKAVAADMGISAKTVDTYCQRIYEKLGIEHGLIVLTHFAIRSGFVKLMEFKEL